MTAPGMIAGRYRIEGRLGVGGMSTVQLAFDDRLVRRALEHGQHPALDRRRDAGGVVRQRLGGADQLGPLLQEQLARDGWRRRGTVRGRRSSMPGATRKGTMVALTWLSWLTMSTMRSAVWSWRIRRQARP